MKKTNSPAVKSMKYVLVAAMKTFSIATVVSAASYLAITQVYAADISANDVQGYANSMSSAANSKNVNGIKQLLADDVIISIHGNGSANLDKTQYLRQLQKNWSEVSNYHFDISISNVVVMGNQAKADVVAVETYLKDGKPVKFTTKSRATFSLVGGKAVLSRAVSEVTIN